MSFSQKFDGAPRTVGARPASQGHVAINFSQTQPEWGFNNFAPPPAKPLYASFGSQPLLQHGIRPSTQPAASSARKPGEGELLRQLRSQAPARAAWHHTHGVDLMCTVVQDAHRQHLPTWTTQPRHRRRLGCSRSCRITHSLA